MEQGSSGTCTRQDNEWSEGSFMLDRMAEDPRIGGFFHIRTMLRSGTIQWHIWEPSTCCSDIGEQQLERIFIQAFLGDK